MSQRPTDNVPRSFDCARARDRLEAFVDGDLVAEEARWLGAHVEACSDCAGELAAAQRVTVALRSLDTVSCPDSVIESLARQMDEGESPRTERYRARWQGLAVAAAVLALVLAGVALRIDRSGSAPTGPAALSSTEIAQAEAEVRLAFAYLGAVTRRARATLENDVLVDKVFEPPMRALGALGRDPGQVR